jgi:four helix bundle protein
MNAKSFKDLTVYKKSFVLAMDIFEITKKFPKEEMYSLTDQIRRSSHSVTASIAEAYRKRNYPAYFVSKSSDADMENSETRVWLDFAEACKYLNTDIKRKLDEQAVEIGKLLNHMIESPSKYSRKLKDD